MGNELLYRDREPGLTVIEEVLAALRVDKATDEGLGVAE